MSDALTIPPDLTDEEREAVEAFRKEAAREADESAALFVRVRRLYAQLRPAFGRDGALGEVADRLPVSVATAERIVYGKGRWGLPA